MLTPLMLAVLLSSTAPTGPVMVVKEGNAAVEKVLKSAKPTVDALAAKADVFVDFGELARRALGKEWDKLNKKQQAEFSQTMKGLLRASYAQRAIHDAQDSKAANPVTYGAETVQGNEADVPTTLQVAKDTVPVVYKLSRPDPKGRWKIYDVVTDEVSLVSTYRDQFRKLIADKGYAGLLATLKAKKLKLENTRAATASTDKATGSN